MGAGAMAKRAMAKKEIAAGRNRVRARARVHRCVCVKRIRSHEISMPGESRIDHSVVWCGCSGVAVWGNRASPFVLMTDGSKRGTSLTATFGRQTGGHADAGTGYRLHALGTARIEATRVHVRELLPPVCPLVACRHFGPYAGLSRSS